MLMQEIGRLYDANQRWKDELIAEMDRRFTEADKRMKHHFGVVSENLLNDFKSAKVDQIENHEDKLQQRDKGITRLEKHTKLIAA